MVYSNSDREIIYATALEHARRDFPEAVEDPLKLGLYQTMLVGRETCLMIQIKRGQLYEREAKMECSGDVTIDSKQSGLAMDILWLLDVSVQAGQQMVDICRHLGTDLE